MFLVLHAEARVPEDQPMTLKSHSEAIPLDQLHLLNMSVKFYSSRFEKPMSDTLLA